MSERPIIWRVYERWKKRGEKGLRGLPSWQLVSSGRNIWGGSTRE